MTGLATAPRPNCVRMMRLQHNLRLITHAQSCGQSAAVRSGVAAARAPVVVTLDGDGQNDPAFIPALLTTLASDAQNRSRGRPACRAKVRQGSRKYSRALPTPHERPCCVTAHAIPAAASRRFGATCSGTALFRRAAPFSAGLGAARGLRGGLCGRTRSRRLRGVSNYGLWDRLWVGILDLAGVWWLVRRREARAAGFGGRSRCWLVCPRR